MRVFRNFIRTFKASSLGNMLTGKGILRASYGNKKGKGMLRDGYWSKNFQCEK